jgi:hypothetical protein
MAIQDCHVALQKMKAPRTIESIRRTLRQTIKTVQEEYIDTRPTRNATKLNSTF